MPRPFNDLSCTESVLAELEEVEISTLLLLICAQINADCPRIINPSTALRNTQVSYSPNVSLRVRQFKVCVKFWDEKIKCASTENGSFHEVLSKGVKLHKDDDTPVISHISQSQKLTPCCTTSTRSLIDS